MFNSWDSGENSHLFVQGVLMRFSYGISVKSQSNSVVKNCHCSHFVRQDLVRFRDSNTILLILCTKWETVFSLTYRGTQSKTRGPKFALRVRSERDSQEQPVQTASPAVPTLQMRRLRCRETLRVGAARQHIMGQTCSLPTS